MMYPRKETVETWNSHFSPLTQVVQEVRQHPFWRGWHDFPRTGIYQNIVDVRNYKCSQHISQHVIYETLEHRGDAEESVWHDCIFVVAWGVLCAPGCMLCTNPASWICEQSGAVLTWKGLVAECQNSIRSGSTPSNQYMDAVHRLSSLRRRTHLRLGRWRVGHSLAEVPPENIPPLLFARWEIGDTHGYAAEWCLEAGWPRSCRSSVEVCRML